MQQNIVKLPDIAFLKPKGRDNSGPKKLFL